MIRDHRLHELNDDEFERFVVLLCTKWLGPGVLPFARGKDGGRDGKFLGTAQTFPSAVRPYSGHFVLQAKHTSAPNKSCSDRDFQRLLKAEHPKIAKLAKEGICEHYLVFTNRKLTGETEKKLVVGFLQNGVKTGHIVGVERLHLEIDGNPDIRDTLPNKADTIPFRFQQEDLIEVIGAVHDFVSASPTSIFDSAHDFDSVHIRDVKNKINDLSEEYYTQLVVAGSMPYFHAIEDFLKNPRNASLATLYHDAADELKQKILVRRAEFPSFDDVFGFIYEEVQKKRSALRGKRRMISIVLHYMYCNCDIGSKNIEVGSEVVDADA